SGAVRASKRPLTAMIRERNGLDAVSGSRWMYSGRLRSSSLAVFRIDVSPTAVRWDRRGTCSAPRGCPAGAVGARGGPGGGPAGGPGADPRSVHISPFTSIRCEQTHHGEGFTVRRFITGPIDEDQRLGDIHDLHVDVLNTTYEPIRVTVRFYALCKGTKKLLDHQVKVVDVYTYFTQRTWGKEHVAVELEHDGDGKHD